MAIKSPIWIQQCSQCSLGGVAWATVLKECLQFAAESEALFLFELGPAGFVGRESTVIFHTRAIDPVELLAHGNGIAEMRAKGIADHSVTDLKKRA